MEKKHKDLLISNRVYLVQELDLTTDVLDYLVEEKVLSGSDEENLKYLRVKSKMAQEFLSTMLPKRGPQAFEKFIKCLMMCDQQKYIAIKLDPLLAAKYGDITDEVDCDMNQLSITDEDIIAKLNHDVESALQSVCCSSDEFRSSKLASQDVYRMASRPRGHAVIINNKHFICQQTRVGAENDAEQLEQLFEKLHFKVILHEDMTAQGIRDIVKNESQYDHGSYDAFAMFILSHGVNGRILGRDEQDVNIDDDIAEVIGGCDTLRNKPKMIFIQACRNERSDKQHVHGGTHAQASDDHDGMMKLIRSQEQEDGGAKRGDIYHDFFVAYATIPGFTAVRNTAVGSWFVRYFIYVCSSSAHNEVLQSIMTKVNRLLSKKLASQQKQIGETVVRLTKKIYFLP